MLKMTIDNEEVVSNKDISIKEEILSPSSTILNNVYPKEWENDKDYTSRFYYPKDYSKLNIQNFSVEPEEAGTTVEINENATINDVDTTKESRVISLKGQTSQDGTPTPSSPIPVNVASGNNTIDICGKNLFDKNSVILGKVWNGASNTKRAYGYIKAIQGQVYTASTQDTSSDLKIYLTETATIGTVGNHIKQTELTSTLTFTPQSATKYIVVQFTTTTNDITQEMVNNALIQIEKGTTTTYEPYIGNTYPIYLGVENLFDGVNYQGYITSDGQINTSDARLRRTDYLPVNSNTQYTISTNTSMYGIGISCYDSAKAFISRNQNSNVSSVNFTTPSNAKYVIIAINYNNSSNLDSTSMTTYGLQLELGNKRNHTSTQPIELCKIGDYQDYIYKDNGSWYVHKEIDKYLIKPTSGELEVNGIRLRGTETQTPINAYPQLYCEYFSRAGNYTEAVGTNYPNRLGLNSTGLVLCNISGYTTVQEYLDLFTNNDIYVYYPLATPTNTLIEDTTLISQLDNLSS